MIHLFLLLVAISFLFIMALNITKTYYVSKSKLLDTVSIISGIILVVSMLAVLYITYFPL